MSSLKYPSNFAFIVERAKSLPSPMRVVIAGADNENILRGAFAAQEEGFVEPILIGNYKKIKTMTEAIGIPDMAKYLFSTSKVAVFPPRRQLTTAAPTFICLEKPVL